MKTKHTVRIVGRDQSRLDELGRLLNDDPDLEVKGKLKRNASVDPLHNINPLPDLLILDLSAAWEDELKALAVRPANERLPFIALGQDGSTPIVRAVMQAGARDFFTHPVPIADLLASVHKIIQELSAHKVERSQLIAVMNAKGGCGASFLATNISHILAARLGIRTALVDFDLQFGSLPLYLDLAAANSIQGALEHAHQLDTVALDAYLLKHASGLRLLPATTEELRAPDTIPVERLEVLLQQLLQNYDQIVVDLPRQFDVLTQRTLELADTVLIVMQQGITQLRDAGRIIRILTKDLAIPGDRIRIIVNRYDPEHAIPLDNIESALKPGEMHTVPNDYRLVTEAIDLGKPVYELARGAALTRSLATIAAKLVGAPIDEEKKYLFKNVFNLFAKR